MDTSDVENAVFNDVATALRNDFSGISVYGEYVPVVNSFPSVSLFEFSNTTSSQDMSGESTHFTIALQLDAYSNKRSGKKSECKSIVQKASEVIMGYGFKRIVYQQMPNLYDATIYRITARYERTFAEGDLARLETTDSEED